MNRTLDVKKDLIKALIWALLALYLIPSSVLWLVTHAESKYDDRFLRSMAKTIDGDPSLTRDMKARAKRNFEILTPTYICRHPNPSSSDYRESVCTKYSELWQYEAARTVSLASLSAATVLLLMLVLLGLNAFVDRRARFVSFLLGWNIVRLSGAALVFIYGSLVIWSSYWAPKVLLNADSGRLMVFVGVIVFFAALHAVLAIFKRPPKTMGMEGMLLAEEENPAFWSHLRILAEKIETAPPKQIVGGIDANFFVTESPLMLGETELTGRTLYVSLPLLRILTRDEADSVFAHELAHFRAGDTASSAALGPLLSRFDYYCFLIGSAGAARLVFPVASLYRYIFEFALQRDSRALEFAADALAAKIVSPAAVVRSLIKSAAYAKYRSTVEEKLFAHERRHEQAIGIAERVAIGLAPFAASEQFLEHMRTANVPHPFDSHPPIWERMRNVCHQIREADFCEVVSEKPAADWIGDIHSAESIEQALWGRYEVDFSSNHELQLAHCYAPSSDLERDLVVKHFPPLEFELKGGQKLAITYLGVSLSTITEEISWEGVIDVEYESGWTADTVKLIHARRLFFPRQSKMRLKVAGDQRDTIRDALFRYFYRSQYSREQSWFRSEAR